MATSAASWVLGDNLDLEHIEPNHEAGVLRLVVPVAEKPKPRKIEITGATPDPAQAGRRPYWTPHGPEGQQRDWAIVD